LQKAQFENSRERGKAVFGRKRMDRTARKRRGLRKGGERQC